MNESLCAHCKNCEEVKYDGFLCDCTGYIEDKTTSTGCVMFEDDGFVNPETTNKEENTMNNKNHKYSMSDIIATMAINGATRDELERAIKYSAAVIDAERARKTLGIDELVEKYINVDSHETYEAELDAVDAFFDKYNELISTASRNSLLGMCNDLDNAMVCIEGHIADETESNTNNTDLKEAEEHITHVALLLAQMWADENPDIELTCVDPATGEETIIKGKEEKEND